MVKKLVQRLLRRGGVYHRLKSSVLYDLYWSLADRRVLQQRAEELWFYRKNLMGLRRGDLIFDVGANQGFKTDVFLRLGAHVVAVDPDPANVTILKEKFIRWRWRKPRVSIVPKALGRREGLETLWMTEPGSAKNTLNPKWVETLSENPGRFGRPMSFREHRQVDVTTLEELFRCHGRPYYVKIDVEGYEVDVLRGLESAVPLLSFEVNLPEFLAEARQCIAMLCEIESDMQWNLFSDCTRGMSLKEWTTADGLLAAIEQCRRPSIEVFCHSAAGLALLRRGIGSD